MLKELIWTSWNSLCEWKTHKSFIYYSKLSNIIDDHYTTFAELKVRKEGKNEPEINLNKQIQQSNELFIYR